jgi:hypothetical protein
MSLSYANLDYANPPALPVEPSAPLFDPSHRGLEHFSYDQVVAWWNALTDQQRQDMQREGGKLAPEALSQLRADYKQNYPQEYFPKAVYSPKKLSACDYYLMYYLSEEMSAKYSWFNQALIKAFEVPPPAYDDSEPPTYAEATRWWKGLPEEQRKGFENRQFEPRQIITIHREYSPYYRSYHRAHIYGSGLDFYDYYLLSRYPSRVYGYPFWVHDDYLLFQSLRTSFELTRLAVHGGYHTARFLGKGVVALLDLASSGVKHFFGFLSEIGSNLLKAADGDKKGGALAVFVGFLVVVGTVAAASAAVVGSLYTSVKSASSLSNIFEFKKLGRSLWRLGCMAAGAYVGATQGMVVGAMVGSVVPGVGTAVGAIIGAIFGAPITAALAGAFAKYSAQALSKYRTGETNPEKWNVEEAQQAQFKTKGRFSMSTAEIRELFGELRVQKNQFKTVKGSFAGTMDNVEKNRFNKFLDGVKKGLDPREGIRVDAHTRFRWDSEKHAIERQNVDLPELKSGLKL